MGVPVVKHLLANGFEVTVLARKDSNTSGIPSGAKIETVDFNDLLSLQAALTGHEGFVDCTLTQDETPQRIMDAAALAGVYRYIPSDWSLDPLNTACNAHPVFSKKLERDNYLFEKCTAGTMTWSIVANGPFLDWNLHTGFMGIDIYNKSASLMDGGDNRIPWTTLDSVGKAVAEIMKHPEETANRPIYISSIVKSCREMLGHVQATLGSADGEWKVTEINGEEANQAALADLFAGKFSMQTFGTMIRYVNEKPEMVGPWPKSDNDLLGIPTMSDAELEALIKEISQRPAPTWG